MAGVSVGFNLSNKVPITVWSIRVSDANAKVLFNELSDEEKARAHRFRQPKDFERFVIAHSLKRFILAEYLGVQPSSLAFDVGGHGKPFCCHPNAPYFNISHSGDWVVIGVSLLSEIGVDIEFSRDINCQELVDRVCSASQKKQFEMAGFQKEMFLMFWTQKEAIAKACGKGISVGLPEISCSGCLGSEEVLFLHQRYWLWTHQWLDKGVVCIASATGDKPKHFIATEFDGVHFSFRCGALETFSLTS